MKLQTCFQFSLKELRSNRLLFALCSLLLVSIISTGLFIAYSDESIMKSFYNYTLKFNESGTGLYVYFDMPYEMLSLIDDQPFDQLYFNGDSDYGSYYSFKENSLEDYEFWIIDVNSEAYLRMKEEQKTEGVELTEDNSLNNYIWVSKQTSEYIGCEIGDIIIKCMPNGRTFEYEVTGIYSDENEHYSDFYISSARFFYDINEAGYTREAHFTAVLANPEKYNHIKNVLKARHVSAWTDYDEEFDMLALIDVMLKSLFVIVMISAMFVVYNIEKIIFRNRLSFIMRLKMLGATTGNAVSIYLIIMECILCLSFVFSFILSFLFSLYVKRIVEFVIPEIEFVTANIGKYVLAGCVICTAILFLVMHIFKTKVDRQSISQVLQDG